MSEYIFEFLMYMFAAYGFFLLLTDVLRYWKNRKTGKGTRFYLAVENSQETIEGTVKTLMRSGLPQRLTEDRCITVVDCGSSDETPEILRRLEKDMDGVIFLK